MTYRARRFLFFTSIVAFFLISGPLLLYAFGFHFSFSDFTIRRTGGLFVHTTPANSLVVIGAREQTTSFLTGNTFIQNVQPRRYTVRVSHDGYQSWERTVRIQPQTVTELSLVLAPVSPVHTPLVTAPSTYAYISPQASLILLLTRETDTRTHVSFFDTRLRNTLPFADALSQKVAAALPQARTWYWNKNETNALAETPDDWLLMTRTNDTIQIRSLYHQSPLANLLSEKPRYMAAHPENKNNYFLLDKNHNLVSWDFEKNTLQQLLQSIAGFSVGADHLLLWDTQSNLPYITALNATQARPYATTSIPSLTEARIDELGTDMLLKSDTGTWFLSSSGKFEKLANFFLSHLLYTDAYILWWNEHAVTIHWKASQENLPTFQQKRKEVIYQTAATLRNVVPYPEEQYIIIQEDNKIFTLELDSRGERRVTQLLYEGANPSFRVPPDKRILYVYDNGSVFTIELP